MPNPRGPVPGQVHLHRDNQQWIFDYVIQQSGRVYHWWTGEEAALPPSVRSHAMVSKHLGRRGLAKEAEARSKLEAGDRDAALRGFWSATRDLIKAQHHIFEVDAEKTFLYESMRRAYEMVRELCPYTIERIEVPWEGTIVAGYLHLCPGVERAPLLFYVPGCDTTCESSPNPIGQPQPPARAARVLVRRPRPRPEQHARHPPDRGQLRGGGERSTRRADAATGDRRRPHRRLRRRDGLVLGDAPRRHRPPHRRCRDEVQLLRQVLHHERGLTALQAAVRVPDASVIGGRARRDRRRDGARRVHGADPLPDADAHRGVRPPRPARGGLPAVRPAASPPPSCGCSPTSSTSCASPVASRSTTRCSTGSSIGSTASRSRGRAR